jgi:8-oxo-dGTP pyrophosphatase MutT (NUDIX family)
LRWLRKLLEKIKRDFGSKKILWLLGNIGEKDNKILIAQRCLDKKFSGRWEFPGGKLEKGE